ATRIQQRDVRRQVLVLGPKAIGDPGAERRAAGDRHPGVHVAAGLLVILVLGDHGADKRYLVGVPAQFGQQLRQLHAGLTALMEPERAAEPGPGLLSVHVVDKVRAWFLAVLAAKLGLGVKQIDLAWAAVLEQVDDALRNRTAI